jgi:hypothetical protein
MHIHRAAPRIFFLNINLPSIKIDFYLIPEPELNSSLRISFGNKNIHLEFHQIYHY